MIHYDLRCAAGHDFDGWFRDSRAFDEQAVSGLLECAFCGTSDVRRAIMAPRVARGAAVPMAAAPPPLPAADKPSATPVTRAANLPAMPDQMRAVLQRIRAEIERKCDYVGPRFAEAARAIHDGEAPPRPIYGESTPDEAQALADDGIEIASIPWVPRADG